MKFRIACDDFAQMLSRLQGFLSRASNSLSAILSNVLLRLEEDGTLHLSATDLEISFHGTLQVKDQVPGAITVDGKRLFAMIRQLPNEEVKVEVTDTQDLRLESGYTEMSLSGIDAEEFPETPSEQDSEYFPVKGGVICELFERSLFSTSTDEGRPNLNGVLFQSMGDGILRSVSTDGHRLTMVERFAALTEGETASGPIPEFPGQIVPRKGVSELKKLLEEYPEVEFALGGQFLLAKTPDFFISIRLIAERFPPYEAVIPKSNERIYHFDRAELLKSLKRMGLVGEDKLHGVCLEFVGDEVLLESKNVNLGNVNERLKMLEGSCVDEMRVSFTVQYMVDILSVIKGKTVQLCLGQAEKIPGIFKDPEAPQDIFVVMPRRL